MTQSRANSWRDNSEMESLYTLGEGEENLRSNRLEKFTSIFVTYISRVASASEIGAINQGGDREERNDPPFVLRIVQQAKKWTTAREQIRKRKAGRRDIHVALLCTSSQGETCREGEGLRQCYKRPKVGFTARTNHATYTHAIAKNTSVVMLLSVESTTSECNIYQPYRTNAFQLQ